jgi:hypothetical protein
VDSITSTFHHHQKPTDDIETTKHRKDSLQDIRLMDREKPPLSVYAVILVSFDHALGPTVEWSYPPSLAEHEALSQQINRNLPFLALPDGAHLVSKKKPHTI